MKNLIIPVLSVLLSGGVGAQEDIFGSNTDNTGVSGFLYDLKYDKDGDVNKDVYGSGNVRRDEVYKEIEGLSRKGFAKEKLEEFRQGDAHCYLKSVAVPNSEAELAPVAFGSPEIDPSAIIIVYSGVVKKAPRGPLRFAGKFDDLMMVLVNGEVVFYYARAEDMIRYSGQELTERAKATIRDVGLANSGGEVYGEYLELEKGDTLQIVLAEIPGGMISGGLKVQMKRDRYKEDKYGDPILPPFVAGELTDEEKERIKKSNMNFSFDDVPEFEFETE